MEKNKEIMQEFFFKKKEKVSDQLKRKYGYEPVDSRKEGQPGFGSIISSPESGLAVTDAKEAGKRVVSALGASLGINSVKNIASKSIKSFPIIVSENIEPETSVMLKRVLEEQYAEYISLLISNQIVDITAFKTSEDEGNIAIQAINRVAADDETVQSKIAKGKVSPNELLGNLTAYNLIRNESYTSNNAFLDALLEGAFVVPASQSENLMEFYHTFYDDIVLLNENNQQDRVAKFSGSENEKGKLVGINDFLLKDLGLKDVASNKKNFDALRGLEKTTVSDNPEYKRWKTEFDSLNKRIDSLEKELDQLRKEIKKSYDSEDKRVEGAEKLFRIAENELEKEVLKRKQLNSKSGVTQDEKDMQDLIVAQARDKVIRLDLMTDPKDPQGALEAIDIVENELESLRNEKRHLEVREPAQKTETIEKFNRLSTPMVMMDRDQINKAMNSSIAEILLSPKNEFIRDRFEKATFLLESNRIAGVEYIEYLVQRLGIPVSSDLRRKLVVQFKISDIVDPQNRNRKISRADVNRIASNRVYTEKLLISMLRPTGKAMLTSIILGTAAASTASMTGAATTIAGLFGIGEVGLLGIAPAILGPAIAGVGVAALSAMVLAAMTARSRQRKLGKIAGWERVEMIIEKMDEQSSSIRKVGIKRDIQPDEEEYLELRNSEFKETMDNYKEKMQKILATIKPKEIVLKESETPIFDIDITDLLEFSEAEKVLNESLSVNVEYKQALNEAVVQTTIPQTLELKYEYDPKKAPDILAAPKFSQRSQYAYGSVEYDKRELKDRRYNAPLLMKVNFKERFSDGTFSDNELTAVIGILGVVTRVPSKEMEYILSSNADGNTVKGILAPEGDSKKLISDILGIDKIKKDVKNLPMSADVWQNLEKVSRLAISNKLAGRKDNNIANAHIVFAQKEIDNIRADEGVDYMKNVSLASSLMKRYSAFTVMIANDISERLYIFDDLSSSSWDIVPYSAFRNKDTGDQLNAMLNKMSSGRL
jgi:predicted RNA-binding protein